MLPLGLDSFAVAAAMGASQALTVWQRLRISLVFVIFEDGMPLIGLGLGAGSRLLEVGCRQIRAVSAAMTVIRAMSM